MFEAPHELGAIQPEMIGIGAQESDGINRSRQLVGATGFQRREVDRLDPQRGGCLFEIESQRFAPMPQNIVVEPFDGQNWEANAPALAHLSKGNG